MHQLRVFYSFFSTRVTKRSRQIRVPRSINVMNKLMPALIDEGESKGVSLCSLTEQLCL